jgi:hypothetical protein
MLKLTPYAVLLVGCVSTESSHILTSGIYAAISADAEDDGSTDISATLYLGNPLNFNFVDLTGDDRLVVSAGAVEKRMTEINVLNAVSHHAEFGTIAAGTEFTVSLIRTVDAGAPSSIATLPEPFTIDPPATSASRAASLTLTWAPSGTADQMAWELEGDCIEREFDVVTGDPGTATIAAGRVRQRMAAGTADSCEMTVTIRRAREGILDPGYGEGGTVFGRQLRRVSLTTTP